MRIISGSSRGKRLFSPGSLPVRPTSDRVKEAFFNCLSGRVAGTRFLDLFAGTGGVGIEALSREAGKVVFVDHNRKLIELIRKNLATCGFPESNWLLEKSSVFRFLKFSEADKFDIIFLDPPYHFPEIPRLIKETMKCCAEGGTVTLEHHCGDIVPNGFYDQRKYGESALSFYGKR
ncbi:MAG: 16S rRNA (guanine(966)-N(2))-methyltransferase RsmD [bacterium]